MIIKDTEELRRSLADEANRRHVYPLSFDGTTVDRVDGINYLYDPREGRMSLDGVSSAQLKAYLKFPMDFEDIDNYKTESGKAAFNHLLGYHLEQAEETESLRIIADVNGDTKVKSIVPKNALLITGNDIIEIYDSFRSHLGNITPREYVQSYSGEIFRFTTDKMKDVRVGEPVAAGVEVGFSSLGIQAPWVAPYYEVLRCTNGAVSIEQIYKWSADHVDIEIVKAEIVQRTMRAIDYLDVAVNYAKKLDEDVVDDPDEILEQLAKQHKLSAQQLEYALEVLSEDDNPNTMWAITNAVTATANSDIVDFKQRRRLQLLGGDMVDSVAHPCPTCHRPITGDHKH